VNASELVQAFAASRPRAVELAEVVSFAVLVDRPLLRQARVRLVPGADAGAEADLWLSPLVKSRSAEGITFTPEVAAVLRARLAADSERKDEAWKLTTAMHEHLPPTLKLEETINHLSIDGSAEAARKIDELLNSVLAAMAAGGRDGLASWAARALAGFPTSVRQRSTARMLAAGASLRLGVDPRRTLGGDLPEWLRFVAPAQLPVETVGVQLAPGVLRVDASKNPAGQHLRLPATRPYLLDVSWTAEDGKEEGLQLALRAGDVEHVHVGAGEVRLRTVAGDTYEVRLGGTAPADVRRHIIDFSEVLGRAGAIEPSTFTGVTLFVGPRGSGKTSTLAALCNRWMSEGAACAHHFFERGIPHLEYWEFAERSLIAQLMTRYDAPPWAVSMALPDFLRMIAGQTGTGTVYIVLDNVDVVQKNYSVSKVLEPFLGLPPQFVIVASAVHAQDADVRTIALEPRRENIARVRPNAARQYLDALAAARAPLPLADAERLRARLDLSSLDVKDWTVRRMVLGEPSIALADEFLRKTILTEDKSIHGLLAEVIEVEEPTWYGVRYGAWHRLRGGDAWASAQTSTAVLRRLTERFGAAIAADALEELSSHISPLESFGQSLHLRAAEEALRRRVRQANEVPQDLAPLLYSALRQDDKPDQMIEDTLALVAGDISLRVESYIPPPTGTRPRIRPPGPVAAIEVSEEHEDIVLRCNDALMFIDGNAHAVTIDTPPLTASAMKGDVLMTGDAEGTVTFWIVSTRQLSSRVAAHQGAVTQTLLTETRAFSCGADGTVVQFEKSGEEWVRGRTENAPAGISAAAITGDFIAVGCRNGDILEVAPSGPTLHARAHDGPVTGLAWRLDPYGLVSTGADRKLRVCVPGRPELAVKAETGHTLGISGLAASLQPELFATYSADRTVRPWWVDGTGEPLVGSRGVFYEHEAAVTIARFGHSARGIEWLVTGSADGVVMVRDTKAALLNERRRHSAAVRACAFRKGHLFTGGDDGRLVRSPGSFAIAADGGITDCASAGGTTAICMAGHIRVNQGLGRDGSFLALSPDGRRIVSWDEGATEAVEWDAHTGKDRQRLAFDAPIVGCIYVDDAPMVALENGRISMYTVSGEVRSYVREIGRVTAVAARDANTGASGSIDGEVIVWQGATEFRVRRAAAVSRLAFSGTDTIVVAYDDGVMTTTDHRAERHVTAHGHRLPITGLVVDDKSQRIFTASVDKTVRVWDLSGNQRGIVYGDHPFSAMTLLRDGQVLAGDDAGALWTLTYHDEIELEPPPGLEMMPPTPRPKGSMKGRLVKKASTAKVKPKPKSKSSKGWFSSSKKSSKKK
jgi:WD40 repeat protein